MTRALFFTAGVLLGTIAGLTAAWAVSTVLTDLSRHGLGEPYL